MNIDGVGHKHGLDSRQYRNSAFRYPPIELPARSAVKDGYQVIITGIDHGMNNDLSHGGILPEGEVRLLAD